MQSSKKKHQFGYYAQYFQHKLAHVYVASKYMQDTEKDYG